MANNKKKIVPEGITISSNLSHLRCMKLQYIILICCALSRAALVI